ncbi:MAG TPA: hypothetical protein VFH38_09510 [Jatrophihabitans sp.]|nr:hypothetical protein [Jatrophihabitans sp.]
MSTYAAQLDLEAVFRPPKACPECGTPGLLATDAAGRANFFCAACERCWHLEMGWLSLVDPRDCARCRRQDQCLARRAAQSRAAAIEAEEGDAPCGSA